MDPILTFVIGAVILLLLMVYLGTTEQGRKVTIGILLAVIATGFAVTSIKVMGIKKGIDLLGGSEFVVKLQESVSADGTKKPVTNDDIQQAIGILEKRLNPEGNKDLLLAPQGENRILIQMPGVSEEDVQDVRNRIEQVAKLEFRIAHENSASKLAEIKANGGVREPGWVELPFRDKEGEGEGPTLLVRNRPDLEGKYVSSAFPSYDAEGWKVYLNLDSEGADLFDQVAAANKGRQMAIIVDGEIISAPVLQTDKFGGTAVISGSSFKEQEVRTLSSLLENPLENPMEILSESAVSAAYGESAIKQGMMAGLVGLGIILLFMLFYYRLAGIIAIIGLVINITLLFGAMALFQFTLTMPGIAGIALTLGMAVDANVLIYERLREEMNAGKSLGAALEAAFDKAFSAIFDSNLTTLITAIILFTLASGLVKGFAVTLTVGLITSLFGALIVTRVIFTWCIRSGLLKKLTTTRIIPDKIFNVLSLSPKFITMSLLIAAVSFGTFFTKGKHSLGIDFRGGALVHAQLAEGKSLGDADIDAAIKDLQVEVKDAEGNIKTQAVGTYYIQHKQGATGEMITIRGEFDSGPAIEKALNSTFPKDTIIGTQSERVGSLIGSELAEQSGWAMLIALAAIFLYLLLRFEFAFALGAIAALFHDVLIVPGLCVLFGQELSVIHIGALLTIAGYSINDTIIVFDRIREVIQRGGGKIRDMMNEAISLTLSRTLLTAVTTLFPMLVLMFFGNPAMAEFAMPILLGVLIGTYSSIFIATPVVLWYARRSGQSLRRQVLDTVSQGQTTVQPSQA